MEAVWLKVADADPTVSLPDPNADAYALESYIGAIARALRVRYPNLQARLRHEPDLRGLREHDAESRTVRLRVGLRREVGDRRADRPGAGRRIRIRSPATSTTSTGVAPWLGWAVYPWADGPTPRCDGLTWDPADFQSDGTHPSSLGEQKVATMLLDFFKTDPRTRPWFLAHGDAAIAPVLRRRGRRRAGRDLGPRLPGRRDRVDRRRARGKRVRGADLGRRNDPGARRGIAERRRRRKPGRNSRDDPVGLPRRLRRRAAVRFLPRLRRADPPCRGHVWLRRRRVLSRPSGHPRADGGVSHPRSIRELLRPAGRDRHALRRRPGFGPVRGLDRAARRAGRDLRLRRRQLLPRRPRSRARRWRSSC